MHPPLPAADVVTGRDPGLAVHATSIGVPTDPLGLVSLAGSLSGLDDLTEVVDAVLDHVRGVEGALVAALGVLADADEDLLAVHVRRGEVTERTHQRVLDDGALRFEGPVGARPCAVVGHGDGVLDDVLRRAGATVVSTFPLGSEDRPEGILIAAFAEATDGDAARAARLALVARIAGQAARRARRSRAADELIDQLQAELLAAIDAPPDLDLAARYVPAAAEIGLGGDWYDVIADGDVVRLVIGDVVGHGVTAAAKMARIKSKVRTLASLAMSPSEVLQTAATLLAREGSSFVATAQVVELSRATGGVRSATAGHLPAMVRDRGGAVRCLEPARLPPLALSPRQATVAVDGELLPGALVVLFTDGLVERRDRTIDEGTAQLVAAMAALPDDVAATAAADGLLDAMGVSPGGRDDAAVLVVRIPG